MLSVRIIPCLDVHGGRVVKGIKFEELRDAGDPVAVAAAYFELLDAKFALFTIAAMYSVLRFLG